MPKSPWFALVAAVPMFVYATVASSSPFAMTLFGHQVSISPSGDQFKLEIDEREVLRNYYLDLDEIYVINGTPTVVGTSSGGGNACEGAPFIVSFPRNESPRLDGPLDTCFGVKVEASDIALTLSTAPTPNEPGKRWTWTPSDGIKEAESAAFVADVSKGWPQLRERTASHPADLLDYAELNEEITRLAGPDATLVNDILMGVGSGKYDGDLFVGTSCSRHMCLDQEAIVIADIPHKTIYLAWKPSGQKIKVNPEVKSWPERPRAALRNWAAKWK
ncbi:hypothetical protein [Pararhizobium sp. A13]|uniref:hypothetical protein n=1 Tax=Pararhizobium sp. A13 TaxID=3133975 RepID=UPI0032483916